MSQTESTVRALGRTASLSIAQVRATLTSASQAAMATYVAFRDYDLVTPRDVFGYPNPGKPYIVIQTKRLERNRNGFGTPAYGKITDLWVAYLTETGTVETMWVESFAFRRWDAATDGSKFDEAAQAASVDFAAELERRGFSPETVTVVSDGSSSTTPVPASEEHAADVRDTGDEIDEAIGH